MKLPLLSCPVMSCFEYKFHISSDTGNGSSSGDTTGPGTFPWAPEVARPERGSSPSEEEHGDGHPADAESRDDRQPWDATISVPPSKAVRDGVCFRGLRVLLFVGGEERKQAVSKTNAGGREARRVWVYLLSFSRDSRCALSRGRRVHVQRCEHRTPRSGPRRV